MELASGLVVFGGTKIWQRLDLNGFVLCGLGGMIAVETRSYAGWFLVSAAVSADAARGAPAGSTGHGARCRSCTRWR